MHVGNAGCARVPGRSAVYMARLSLPANLLTDKTQVRNVFFYRSLAPKIPCSYAP